jgi:AraC-like DNA-binding protein
MPSITTSAFDEREDFETALRAGCRGLVVTGRGQFRAQLTLIRLYRLRLSAVEEQLSRIAFVAVPADMVITAFPIGNTTLPIRGGARALQDEILILPPGEQLHVRTDGLHRWGSIWTPVEDLVRYGGALTGTRFAVPPVAQCWRPPRAAGNCLRSFHAAAMRMAAIRPQTLVNAEAARGLEQQLIHALVECLSTGSADASTLIKRRHQEIMVRFERLLQAQPERNLSISEICGELDVSERRLRALCAAHLGMGPIGYDRLRRMSLVHRIFLREYGDAVSISEVARRHGFRALGRFSVNYRAVFGETPSSTLRRGSGRYMVDPTKTSAQMKVW